VEANTGEVRIEKAKEGRGKKRSRDETG